MKKKFDPYTYTDNRNKLIAFDPVTYTDNRNELMAEVRKERTGL